MPAGRAPAQEARRCARSRPRPGVAQPRRRPRQGAAARGPRHRRGGEAAQEREDGVLRGARGDRDLPRDRGARRGGRRHRDRQDREGIRREEERMASFLEKQIPVLTKEVVRAEIPAAESTAPEERRGEEAIARGAPRGLAPFGSTPPTARDAPPPRRVADCHRRGRPQRPRLHLFADRPDLPAQPRRAGRLQRRQVRRRLLARPSSRRSGASTSTSPSRSGSGPGARVLDLGCGWGPLLDFVRARAATGVGVTLSSAQAEACRRHGLDVHLAGRARVDRETFGPFDAVASLGRLRALLLARGPRGRAARTRSTATFSRSVAALLPDGGRLYLQTMVFGPNMIPIEEVDIDAPRDSDAWYLALMGHQFPGSFLPFGSEQVVDARGAPLPPRRRASSGRLDYIETISSGAPASPSRACARRC